MKPIIAGKPATRLSEVVDCVDDGWGFHTWIVAEVSGHFSEREDAYKLAREWFPDLIDDEDD